MKRHSSPLRHELQAAIHSMRRALKHGWTQRKDAQAVHNSLDKAQAFLNSYPYATDERVEQWCFDNHKALGDIIPVAHHRRLARLLNSELAARADHKPAA